MSKYAVGIDLGTTNTVLSYKQVDSPSSEIKELPIKQIFPDGREVTDILLPSVVYYQKSNNKIFVGMGAEQKKYSALKDINVFYSTKSQLGQDKNIYNRSKCPEKITFPWEASGEILELAFSEFKSSISDKIEDCTFVVTVPASFGGAQRNDTLKAVEKSNIPITDGSLVDEPNAAFIGFVLSENNLALPQGSKVLVFDMGGGTTDISIIEINSIEGDIMDLNNIAVSRYDLLAGDDIDSHIAIKHLYPKFLSENNCEDVSLLNLPDNSHRNL